MRSLRLAALLPILGLAACFSSEQPLYFTNDGQLPLASGNYVTADKSDSWSVSISDDYYLVPGSISASQVVLVPFPGRSGYYIVEKGEQSGYAYALLRLKGRGFSLVKPDCKLDSDRAAADGYASNSDGQCKFTSKDSLVAALDRFTGSGFAGRWVDFAPE